MSVREVIFSATLAALVALSTPARAFDLGNLNLDTIVRAGSAAAKGLKEVTPEEEHYLGRAVAAQLFRSYPLVRDNRRTDYLTTLATYLARHSSRPETFAGYRVGIVEGKAPNAFAAPGGMILLTRGLVELVEDEEQLAAVVAHEIAHVALGHGVSVLKTAHLTEAGAIIGEAKLSHELGDAGAMGRLLSQSVTSIVEKLVVNGYSQDQEFDADREAARILYRAGYAPRAGEHFLQRLAERDGGAAEPKGFASTHPAAGARLERVRTLLGEESLEGETSEARTKRFHRVM